MFYSVEINRLALKNIPKTKLGVKTRDQHNVWFNRTSTIEFGFNDRLVFSEHCIESWAQGKVMVSTG